MRDIIINKQWSKGTNSIDIGSSMTPGNEKLSASLLHLFQQISSTTRTSVIAHAGAGSSFTTSPTGFSRAR